MLYVFSDAIEIFSKSATPSVSVCFLKNYHHMFNKKTNLLNQTQIQLQRQPTTQIQKTNFITIIVRGS